MIIIPPNAPLEYNSFSDLPCFYDLDSFECRSSILYDASPLEFVWYSHRIMCLGEGGTIIDIKCHFLHITLRVYTIRMISDYWCWPWLPGWDSICQVSQHRSCSFCHPFPFQTVHIGTHHEVQPKPKEWELPFSFRGEYPHSLFEILLHGRVVSSPPGIHVCNHLFM